MLLRIFELPKLPTPIFLFGEGVKHAFREVDWFRDDECPITEEANRATLEQFIRCKRYFKEDHVYLVLHPTHPMIINCTENFMHGDRPV